MSTNPTKDHAYLLMPLRSFHSLSISIRSPLFCLCKSSEQLVDFIHFLPLLSFSSPSLFPRVADFPFPIFLPARLRKFYPLSSLPLLLRQSQPLSVPFSIHSPSLALCSRRKFFNATFAFFNSVTVVSNSVFACSLSRFAVEAISMTSTFFLCASASSPVISKLSRNFPCSFSPLRFPLAPLSKHSSVHRSSRPTLRFYFSTFGLL